MSYDDREVFESAPLALVSLEIRLNYEPDLNSTTSRDRFGVAIRELFPILESVQSINFTVASPEQPAVPDAVNELRAFSSDRSYFASITTQALVITSLGSAYKGYETFRPLVEKCLSGLEVAAPFASVKRAGFRFVNEIRVPDKIETVDGWGEWVSAQLLGSAGLLPSSKAVATRGGTRFNRADGNALAFQWGIATGSLVSDDLPLKLPSHDPAEHFFALDMDSFREFDEYEVVDPASLLDLVDTLHEPVGQVFQASLTGKSRELFRKVK